MTIKTPNATQLAASSSPASTPAWHFQLQITSLVKSSLNDKGLIWRAKIRAAKLPVPCCSLPLPVWGGFRPRVAACQAPPWKVMSVGKTEFLLYHLFIWKEIFWILSLLSQADFSQTQGLGETLVPIGIELVARRWFPRGVLHSLPTSEPGSACETVEKSESKRWDLLWYPAGPLMEAAKALMSILPRELPTVPVGLVACAKPVWFFEKTENNFKVLERTT